MKNKNHQAGITLIEIMIALLIGAFLIGGVLEIFINSRQTYRMQENLSRLQENGRFAMEFINKSIRMTGYWGCLIPSNPDADINGTDNGTAIGVDAGTDTLTLIGAFTLSPAVTCGSSANTANSCGVGVNCYTDTSSTITYAISNAVLFQDTNSQNNSLIEGIQDMQILYGADTDADSSPNFYVPAGTAGLNMAQVVSIRISLLGVTLDDNLTAQSVPYTYNGTTTTPTDRKIRRVFNATIAVRNRLP
jgi:type IV pilus assembly protein PilW